MGRVAALEVVSHAPWMCSRDEAVQPRRIRTFKARVSELSGTARTG